MAAFAVTAATSALSLAGKAGAAQSAMQSVTDAFRGPSTSFVSKKKKVKAQALAIEAQLQTIRAQNAAAQPSLTQLNVQAANVASSKSKMYILLALAGIILAAGVTYYVA